MTELVRDQEAQAEHEVDLGVGERGVDGRVHTGHCPVRDDETLLGQSHPELFTEEIHDLRRERRLEFVVSIQGPSRMNWIRTSGVWARAGSARLTRASEPRTVARRRILVLHSGWLTPRPIRSTLGSVPVKATTLKLLNNIAAATYPAGNRCPGQGFPIHGDKHLFLPVTRCSRLGPSAEVGSMTALLPTHARVLWPIVGFAFVSTLGCGPKAPLNVAFDVPETTTKVASLPEAEAVRWILAEIRAPPTRGTRR